MVSRKCAGSSDALVFELYLGTLHGDETESALPEGSSYYLCNPQGDLIYARTQLDATPEELQQYVTTILGQIKAGNLDDAQEYVYDLTHEKRAVYFYTHESGGVSIITVSYSSLLRNLDRVFFLIMSVSSVALLFLVFLGSGSGTSRRSSPGSMKRWRRWETSTMSSTASTGSGHL